MRALPPIPHSRSTILTEKSHTKSSSRDFRLLDNLALANEILDEATLDEDELEDEPLLLEMDDEPLELELLL